MANSSANDWDEASPAITDARRLGAGEIANLRKAVRLRMDKEHVNAAGSGVGGEHESGSAKVYYQSTAPTLRPDGSTSLTSADNGRIWVDSDDNICYVYIHPTWTSIEIDVDTTISSFEKQDGAIRTNPSSTAITKSGLTAGTWLVTIYGTLDPAYGASDTYTATVVVNGVTRSITIDNHPDGSAPFSITCTVTVTGAGTISITSTTGIYRIMNMVGLFCGA